MNSPGAASSRTFGFANFRTCAFGLLVAGLTTLTAVAASDPAADRAWEGIKESLRAMEQKGDGQDAYAQFVHGAELRDELHARLQRFLREYPRDPRTAEATFHLVMRPPAFLAEVNPARFAKEGTAAAVYREDAKRAWEREAEQVKEAFLKSPAITDEWRREIERRDLYIEGRAATEKLQKGEKVDLAALRTRLDEWLKRYPDTDRVGPPVESYMRAMVLADQDAAEAEWDRFAQSQNPTLQELAEGQALILRARRNPIDWKFKALDGREVDLTKLRGKIVLVDFWATWCVPCIAEMPELKALYDRYHARGLEIIGVSLDNAADRGKLEKFVARQGMSWPQHFDGEGRRNAYAVRYGIKSVPTKILLDRDGRVAASRIPTDQLPATLARLLPQ